VSLPAGSSSGQVLKYNGTTWVAGTDNGITSESDGVVGNEVTNATTSGGLTRSGSGTASSPYTLGIASGGVTESHLASKSVGIAKINTTSGTASSSTYLRGDGTWTTPDKGVTKVSGALGLTVTNGTTTATVSLPTGSSGQVLKYNGTAWAAGTDEVTRVPSVTLGNKTWLTYNLGANPALTPKQQMLLFASQDGLTDASIMGDLYQWSRGADGHQYRTSAVTSSDTAIAVDPTTGQPAANARFIKIKNASPWDWRKDDNNDPSTLPTAWFWTTGSKNSDPCPQGFRVPTQADWSAFLGTTSTSAASWKAGSDYNGFYWFPVLDGSPSPLNTWGTEGFGGGLALVAGNSFDPNLVVLFLPAAGSREYTGGAIAGTGSYGYYWSTSNFSLGQSYGVSFYNTGAFSSSAFGRARGMSVRCIAE
jgi:uncharacterized protein (TIGR02145 family)